MICNIEPANPNILAAVAYNEKKANGNPGEHAPEEFAGMEHITDGYILATRNVPEGSTLTGEFERLRIKALKTVGSRLKNPTFHMSVNPSVTDTQLDDARCVEFIDKVMSDLGYREQPYRIYKHTDIARIHYHVVSTRCGQDGKKVKDSYDRLVLRRSLERLAEEYGFTVVQKTKGEEKNEKVDVVEKTLPVAGETKPPVKSFSRDRSEPVSKQLTDAFEDAMNWSFSTLEQLQLLLLKRYNVLLELENGWKDRIVISGTSPDGKQITPSMTEDDLGIQMIQRIQEKCSNANMSARKEQRKRLETLAAAAAARAQSYEEFRAIMAKKGTYVAVSWTRTGEPFGVTYLDRATRCAWKGSETATDFKWLKTVVEKKGWTLERDTHLKALEKRRSMPSREGGIPVRRDPVLPKGGHLSLPVPIPRVAAAGSHHPPATSMTKAKGESIYDESLRQGEEEEKEKKKEKQKQNFGPSL